jgi:hypothetical protein
MFRNIAEVLISMEKYDEANKKLRECLAFVQKTGEIFLQKFVLPLF